MPAARIEPETRALQTTTLTAKPPELAVRSGLQTSLYSDSARAGHARACSVS